MRTLLVGAVLCCSCATMRVERFPVAGTADELRASAQDAAHQLGWETEAAEGGAFRIVEYPRQHWLWKKPLRVTVKDGELAIEGEAVGGWSNAGTVEAARLLASATKQVRGEVVFSPPIEARSEGLTVAFDLLSPAAGAWYALKGHPAYDHGHAMRNFWAEFFGRVASDVAAVGLALEFALLKLPDGSPIFPSWMVAMPIMFLVGTRISAVINDLMDLPFRNAYARSGLRAPAN